MADQDDSCFMKLEALPAIALQQIVTCLPDPSALAASCRPVAALLDQDPLLLAWAATWAPRVCTPQAEHRHAGYALLHWRRLRCMDLPRLAALLLRWVARSESQPQQTAIKAASSYSDSMTGASAAAQQLLDAGNPLGALQALLPHSEHLLLLYAAQAGHTKLVRHLLKAPGAAVQLATDDGQSAEACLLQPALLAAVRGGHVAAMRLLLAALARKYGDSDPTGVRCFVTELLRAAVEGGSRSAACALLLLEKHSDLLVGNWTEGLLEAAAAKGDANVVGALLAAGVAAEQEQRQRAYAAAASGNQLHLLPLLRPSSMDDAAAAKVVCESVDSGPHCCPATVRLLHESMLQLRGTPRAEQLWQYQIIVAVSCDSAAPLADMWTAFSAAGDRAALVPSLWAVLGHPVVCIGNNIAAWALANLVPLGGLLESIGAAAVEAAALAALRSGQMELLAAVQAPVTTANIIADNAKWREAQQQGQLLSAIRSGKAAAVAAQLQTMGEEMLDTFFMRQAFHCAAELPDEDVAAAVVAALAPFLQEGSTAFNCQGLWAHGGRLVRTLFAESAVVRRAMVGSAVHTAEFGSAACLAGDISTAGWLVTQPGQGSAYLYNVFGYICATAMQGGNQQQALLPYMQLLHSLAKWKRADAAAGAAAVGNATDGNAAAADHIAASTEGNSASEEGSSKSSQGKQRPDGARQVTMEVLEAGLELGMPDLLHALLVLMDG